MKLFIVLLSFLFIAACTKVELGYKLAPRSMMSKLDDSFDFQSVRFDQVKSTIEKDFAHNKPAVAKSALQLIDELLKYSDKKEIAPADVQAVFQLLQKSRADLLDLFKPSFAEVIGRLTPDEIKNLSEYSEEKNSEREKLISNRSKFINKQVNSFEKVMDFLFDDMTSEQEKIYEQFISDNQDFYRAQLNGRRNFIKKFATTPKQNLLDYTMDYYSGLPTTRSAEENKIYLTTQNNLAKSVVQIWSSLNDKQRKNYRENLLELREQISPLAN